jgi:hypothetical protein
MRGTTFIVLAVLLLGLVLISSIFIGCSPSKDLGGLPVLNDLPETRITSTPPSLERADIFARFRWTGHDLDGDIVGFQWKMSSNGQDGISIRDTLTIDPSTGDIINPWHFTTCMDTTFVVTADSSNFSGDASLPLEFRHFYQHHTLFVRSMDDLGAVDPSPAMVTFTATTLAPTIRLTTPSSLLSNYRQAKSLPPTFVLGWTGTDPDFVGESPRQVRYILKDAVVKRPGEPDILIHSQYGFNRYKDELLTFSDARWSDWIPYAEYQNDRRRTFRIEPVGEDEEERYYLFAMQARDTAGAVSLDLSYAKTVHNFRIDGSKLPSLTVKGSFFETVSHTGVDAIMRHDIATDQPINVSWYADASEYGGTIEGYRYGWNVEDITNDSDPGWQVPFGNNVINTFSPERSFNTGIHTLVVETRDNSEQVSRVRIVLTVVPIPETQRPLLLIDDVVDKQSQGWPNIVGRPMDEDAVRDQFWSGVLASVEGWIDDVDEYDTQETQRWGYREAVNYEMILWATKNAEPSYIQNNFDGYAGSFIWIESYVESIGNLFLTGAGAVTNFHPRGSRGVGNPWLFPIIYATDDGPVTCGVTNYAMSFGTRTSGGMTKINGLDEFGYRGLGLSMINLTIPPNFYLSENACGTGNFHLTRRCAGTKAIILDPGFKNIYGTAGAFPDTIFVWDDITSNDDYEVGLNYSFGQQDEFYDKNITTRTTLWTPQTRSDGSPMIVPMFHAYSRYDWIFDHYIASGDTDFPGDLPLAIQTYCGSWGLDPTGGRSRTTGVPLGVMTYKTVPSKPRSHADVIWGFDPHMMQHEDIVKAIHWVLKDHFNVPVN